jgi:alanine racemase
MIALEHLLTATKAEVMTAGARTSYEGFAHDSRAVIPGDCFVAVRGIHGDGHDYVLDAVERGAGAVILERTHLDGLEAASPGILEHMRLADVWTLVVPDTREALRLYAAYILHEWHPTVIAVTGSTGKTTTKEAIADVLGTRAPTFRSWRNYNDALGLPLSLGRLEPSHQFAVVELGADHPGEIRELCTMTQPSVGVVTNVSPSHLEYFGDVGLLAGELAELPTALPEGGLAVLNRDDPAVLAMGKRTSARTLFGPASEGRGGEQTTAAGYRVLPISPESLSLTLQPLLGGERIQFPQLYGDHWAYAVLAALTVGEALGVPREQALQALRALTPLPGRMRRLEGVDEAIVLDDSHNATPASAAAGLNALRAIGTALHAPRIAVLGDMLRLGSSEQEAHEALGRLVAVSADYLVTHGVRAEQIAKAALNSGLDHTRIAITHTADDATRAVRQFQAESAATHPGQPAVIYVKGSEEMRMEQVTAQLLAHSEQAEHLLDRQTQAWRRVVVMRPDRPTWLEIDLSAIGENTQRIKRLVGADVQVLVSLKADAYGHGALRVARTVLHNGATWLGVATVSEGQPLRAAGVTAPILVFGYTAPWQARELARLDLRATVYSLESAQALSRAAQDLGCEVRAHVKIDTGMARLGLRTEDIPAIVGFFEELRELPGLVVEGVFTHFATADSADQSYARRQLERFHRVLDALAARTLRPSLVHAANSAATLTLPEAWFDMVRPGIAVYGLAPSDEVRLPEGFRPALAFKTQVAQVKEVPAGEGVSYGATYITTRPTAVAVLPVGYADGFRRAPANWGEVLIRGRRAPIIGRVCMDQCMVDVTEIPGVRQGDEAVLIGRQGDDELTAEAVAERLGTISYEVVAELLARIPRIS